jgi:hypothetical protein
VHGLKDSEGVVHPGIDLDAFFFAAGVFEVKGVEIVFPGQFVEPGIVCVFELIPGHRRPFFPSALHGLFEESKVFYSHPASAEL